MGESGPSRDGGESKDVSLSIEETNKLRASLGLRPLSTSSPSAAPAPAPAPAPAAREPPAELAARVAEARARRRQREELAGTRTLGAADEDVDDVMSWVQRNRSAATAQQRDAGRGNEGDGAATLVAEDDGATALAERAIRGGLEDLKEGESVVLNLEDRGILTEKGELDEGDAALESAAFRADRARERALRAAGKARPLWEEDGRRRAMLDKYDEEEEEELRLDATGGLRRSAALAGAAARGFADEGAGVESAWAASRAGADYESSASAVPGLSVSAPLGPRARHRGQRRRPGGLTQEDVEALAGAAGPAESHMGSRRDRGRLAAARSEADAGAAAAKKARFEAALARANASSAALMSGAGGWEAEDDDEEGGGGLAAALQRAKAETERKSVDAARAVEAVMARRDEPGAGLPAAGGGDAEGLVFTSIGEATRAIRVSEDGERGAEEGEQGPEGGMLEPPPLPMKVEPMQVEEPQPSPPPAPPASGQWGGWVAADGEQEEGEGAEDAAERTAAAAKRHVEREEAARKKREETAALEKDTAMLRSRNLDKGLASALALMREDGTLQEAVEWGGRTNDVKKAMADGLKQVFTGGRASTRLEQSIEAALQHKDEYGRVLAPKEAFRRQCHQFHGIFPSKSTQEKRRRQVAQEMEKRRRATGTQEGSAVEQLQKVQKKSATPFVVLSGTIKPGQSRDAGGALDEGIEDALVYMPGK